MVSKSNNENTARGLTLSQLRYNLKNGAKRLDANDIFSLLKNAPDGKNGDAICKDEQRHELVSTLLTAIEFGPGSIGDFSVQKLSFLSDTFDDKIFYLVSNGLMSIFRSRKGTKQEFSPQTTKILKTIRAVLSNFMDNGNIVTGNQKLKIFKFSEHHLKTSFTRNKHSDIEHHVDTLCLLASSSISIANKLAEFLERTFFNETIEEKYNDDKGLKLLEASLIKNVRKLYRPLLEGQYVTINKPNDPNLHEISLLILLTKLLKSVPDSAELIMAELLRDNREIEMFCEALYSQFMNSGVYSSAIAIELLEKICTHLPTARMRTISFCHEFLSHPPEDDLDLEVSVMQLLSSIENTDLANVLPQHLIRN
jgi:hypothetical protein